MENYTDEQKKAIEKAEKLQEMQEMQSKFWTPVIGIALIIGGFYFFNEFSAFERGETIGGVGKKLAFLYNIGGKWLACSLFWVSGIVLTIIGVKNFIKKDN